MDIADLQEAQAVQVVRQAGDFDVEFPHAKIGALHQRAVSDQDEGAGHQDVAHRVEGAPAAGVHIIGEAAAYPAEDSLYGEPAGDAQKIDECGRADNHRDALLNAGIPACAIGKWSDRK